MSADFEYQRSFDDEKRIVLQRVLEWGATDRSEPPDLSGIESLVTMKNADRTVTYSNPAFNAFMLGGKTVLDQALDNRLALGLRRVSQSTDNLILGGVQSLELEHVGSGIDNRPCTFLSWKRKLDELKDVKYVILLVCRPIEYLSASHTDHLRDLAEMLMLFEQLDATDQAICKRYANGDSTKEIAVKVGLSTRSVENRRQKILAYFGFERPIEIVKLLVRLEENGLLLIED